MSDEKCPVCGKGRFQEDEWENEQHLDCVRQLDNPWTNAVAVALRERAERAEAEVKRLRMYEKLYKQRVSPTLWHYDKSRYEEAHRDGA